MNTEKLQYLIVWEFYVKPGKESKFEAAYRPDGVWARFFHDGTASRSTKPVREVNFNGAYFTLDLWDSRAT